MDLYTANAASSLHQQHERRVIQELEHLRVAKERDSERAATRTETPAITRRRRFSLAAIFRGRTRPTSDCA